MSCLTMTMSFTRNFVTIDFFLSSIVEQAVIKHHPINLWRDIECCRNTFMWLISYNIFCRLLLQWTTYQDVDLCIKI